ncbi:MAG: hypothetical protein GEU86_02190 [Actinophytocola sp.]|nr:hypothetical protein [Actinophytocola sp.]
MVTGDLAHHGLAGEYATFASRMPKDTPWIALPGNHDDPAVMADALAWDGPVMTRDVGDLRVIALNLTVSEQDHGLLKPEITDVVIQAAQGSRQVVLAMHHPPTHGDRPRRRRHHAAEESGGTRGPCGATAAHQLDPHRPYTHGVGLAVCRRPVGGGSQCRSRAETGLRDATHHQQRLDPWNRASRDRRHLGSNLIPLRVGRDAVMSIVATWGFAVALVPIVLTPGASFTLATTRASAGDGPGVAGVVIGTGAGIATHALLAGLGLSAIVTRSADAYTVIRIAGAVYLLWLGLALLWRSRGNPDSTTDPSPPGQALPRRRTGTRIPHALRSAWLANVLNPKAAAVYLTIAPQFLAAEAVSTWSLLTLASAHVLMMATWLAAWTCLILRVRGPFAAGDSRAGSTGWAASPSPRWASACSSLLMHVEGRRRMVRRLPGALSVTSRRLTSTASKTAARSSSRWSAPASRRRC